MKKLLALQLAVIYSVCFLATTNMAYDSTPASAPAKVASAPAKAASAPAKAASAPAKKDKKVHKKAESASAAKKA